MEDYKEKYEEKEKIYSLLTNFTEACHSRIDVAKIEGKKVRGVIIKTTRT